MDLTQLSPVVRQLTDARRLCGCDGEFGVGFGCVPLTTSVWSAALWQQRSTCSPFGQFQCFVVHTHIYTSVYMGVWNEGELTDGGRHIVSGQYHHGPVSPNIIWALSRAAFPPSVTWQQRVEERKREKADGVYLTVENLKNSWVECEQ